MKCSWVALRKHGEGKKGKGRLKWICCQSPAACCGVETMWQVHKPRWLVPSHMVTGWSLASSVGRGQVGGTDAPSLPNC